MNVVTIATSRKFEAAHRQMEDPSKCGFLHGHNWQVDVSLDGVPDTHVGYVIDFKDIFTTIDEFDHTTMLRKDDPLVEVLTKYHQRLCVLPVNATCENLASVVADKIEVVLASKKIRVKRMKVVMHENDHSNATVERTYPGVVF